MVVSRAMVWITVLSVCAAILSCAMAASIGFYTFHKLNDLERIEQKVDTNNEYVIRATEQLRRCGQNLNYMVKACGKMEP